MIGIIFAAAVAATLPDTEARDTQALRALDQALLDATAPGDRKVWIDAMTPDSVYVDENGVIMSHDEFLKQLKPLPKGVSGVLRIAHYSVRLRGAVALVIHYDDERELYHGQHLHTDYLTTETWLRKKGSWRLALTHVEAIDKPPPAIVLSAKTLSEYAGRYIAAPDLTYEIRRSGDHLSGGVVGRPAHALYAESPDVFFATGQPRVRLIFKRTPSGRIALYVSRREGDDLVWKRL